MIFASLIPFFIQLLFSALLWIYAEKITNYILLNNENAQKRSIPLYSQELQAIAFSVIGLVIIADAIPQIFHVIPNLIRLNEIGSSLATPQLKVETIFSLIEKIVRLIIGLILFFGSKGLVGLLKKIREAGIK
ncbi:hypothetical protein BHF71_11290 [Vulcanibacillus modesticaldus]|uniref:Uncharacterized protein n=1 Tax=Vulcanibacillus modesticaldus TaxID=337097 RepID=A0A1D2YS64_9BACI|nr:hypothetical protein [Vulcanibacillus modesticaldus]OEF96891.1 hypothetical protein BHF71_11290 [Vulcanibacillus modesticaldus]